MRPESIPRDFAALRGPYEGRDMNRGLLLAATASVAMVLITQTAQ